MPYYQYTGLPKSPTGTRGPPPTASIEPILQSDPGLVHLDVHFTFDTAGIVSKCTLLMI